MKDLVTSPAPEPVATRGLPNRKISLTSGLRSTLAAKMADGNSRECFWGCTLTKETPTMTWAAEEEDDDQDYLTHTLFLKQATLGPAASDKERNIVSVETKMFNGDEIKQPILCMAAGRLDMTLLDLVFQDEVPVTFRLIEGNGPVHLTASQLVDMPFESEDDGTDTEIEETATEDLTDDTEEERGTKRKASKVNRSKRGKVDSETTNGTTEESTEESMEEEDEEDESEEEEESSDAEESPPPKMKKGKKGKPVTKTKKPVKAVPAKKGRAKGKSK